VTWELGAAPFVGALLAVAALATVGYLKTAEKDPGLTGEVTMLVSFALGGLASKDLVLSAALGVIVAILLYAKPYFQRLSREWVSEQELQDLLMLTAAAVVVLPLLPRHPIDQWGVLDLHMIWRIVVLVMVVGMMGHIAQRAVKPSVGFPIAGFFAGFVSSTLAVASFGKRAKETPELTLIASAAALLANLSSLLLVTVLLGLISPALLYSLVKPLAAAGLILLGIALAYRGLAAHYAISPEASASRAFKLSQALFIAFIITVIVLLSAWLSALFGEGSVLLLTGFVAIAELHAAITSVVQLHATGGLELKSAQLGVFFALAASSIAKSVLAFMLGGQRYGLYVGAGLGSMLVMVILIAAFWLP
jgi:uncharacterized membrane protein (DUF4010 family)